MRRIAFCIHGETLPPGRKASTPDCPFCKEALASAANRSAARRATFTPEEREAYLKYHREYGQRNKAATAARSRLWYLERKLCRAIEKKDAIEIQKRRLQLALHNELIEVWAAW